MYQKRKFDWQNVKSAKGHEKPSLLKLYVSFLGHESGMK
jgi:hypothetical protein